MYEMLRNAKAVAPVLACTDGKTRSSALGKMADALRNNTEEILDANKLDMDAAKDTISPVMLDRLLLTKQRIEAMAKGIEQVADLPDPVGMELDRFVRADGLEISKVSVPIGVVAIIYESRPNVTSDAAALAVKSGNVCVLRSGKEAFRSANAIVKALKKGLVDAGLPEYAVNLVQDTSRDSARQLMTSNGLVDILIPRGGAGLINACVQQATVPCIATGTGICHIYVDAEADLDMALNIIENAKTSRPSVCNAEEVCLVSRAVAKEFLPLLKERLVDARIRDGKTPVELDEIEQYKKEVPFILYGYETKGGAIVFDDIYCDFNKLKEATATFEQLSEFLHLRMDVFIQDGMRDQVIVLGHTHPNTGRISFNYSLADLIVHLDYFDYNVFRETNRGNLLLSLVKTVSQDYNFIMYDPSKQVWKTFDKVYRQEKKRDFIPLSALKYCDD